MSSLFRPEALAAKSNLWLGNVRLTQPIGYALTALSGLGVAVVLGLFGAFGSYTKKATVIGQLAPPGGALRITQASSGNLIETRVKEGDTVRAGDVLFVISSERAIEVRGERRETQVMIASELSRRGEIVGRDAKLSIQRARERTGLAAQIDEVWMQAHAEVGDIDKSQAVQLRYAAYPYQKFSMSNGAVTKISRSPYVVQALPTYIAATLAGIAQAGDPIHHVIVRIKDQAVLAYGLAHTLRAGMLAEVDVVLETKKPREWAPEPAFSVSGKHAIPSPSCSRRWLELTRSPAPDSTHEEARRNSLSASGIGDLLPS